MGMLVRSVSTHVRARLRVFGILSSLSYPDVPVNAPEFFFLFAATRFEIWDDPIDGELYAAAICTAAREEPSPSAPAHNGSSSLVCAQFLTCHRHQHALASG